VTRAVAVGLSLLALPTFVSAQVVDTTAITPDFNRLKTPESPAFHILGISPSAISRPTSPRSFAFSFLDALRGREQFSLIPSNFAVEVNPYWWSSHPDLSFEEYQAGGIRSLYRTLTLSLATTDSTVSGPDGDRSFRRLGVGVRGNLFGRQQEPACLEEIGVVVQPLTDPLAREVATAIAQDPALATDSTGLEDLRKRTFERLLIELPSDQKRVLDQKREQCTDEIADRSGFVMSVAAAAGLGFLESRGDTTVIVPTPTGDLNTLGFWATPSYLSGRFSGIGVVRVLWEDIEADTTEFAWDFGGRAVYSSGRYAASAEALYRRRGRGDERMNEYRLATAFDIRVTQDVWLTATFGKDFEDDEGSGLIALASLQWNFGKPAPRPPPLPGA
jgi:hypothetical protein